MVFQALLAHAIELHLLLQEILNFDLVDWKKRFKKVRSYFARGGMFQRSLKKSCDNRHCCMTFALSHPTMPELQQECDHGACVRACVLRAVNINSVSLAPVITHTQTHMNTTTDHDESNPECLLRDELWDELYDIIAEAIESDNPAARTLLASTGIVGENSSTTVKAKLLNIRSHLRWLRRGHNKYVGHLMLDTMQTLQHFKMRDEVSKSHLLQHSDYMMKLRPLMKNETGSEFHMVMTKGDSVLVSGFSHIGTDAQMASVNAGTGDAMLHHVVTISGDTTQGGGEGYAAIFAQISAVRRFAPECKTISIISDAGSGFKSTACAFGLFWASHLGLLTDGIQIVSWMYPAAGEAKQPETDGAMPR